MNYPAPSASFAVQFFAQVRACEGAAATYGLASTDHPPACLVQGDKERELGLPISPLFDRQKPGASKSQIGFFGERLMSCWSLL